MVREREVIFEILAVERDKVRICRSFAPGPPIKFDLSEVQIQRGLSLTHTVTKHFYAFI